MTIYHTRVNEILPLIQEFSDYFVFFFLRALVDVSGGNKR